MRQQPVSINAAGAIEATAHGLQHDAAPDLLLGLLARSRTVMLRAASTSAIAGLAAALLVVTIKWALQQPNGPRPLFCLLYLALAAIMVTARRFSQRQFVELGQRTLADLRVHIAQRWAHAPLRDLEAAGEGRLFAALVEDTEVLSNFSVQVPQLFMQLIAVCTCLTYLAWATPVLFVVALVAILAGALGHRAASRRATEHLERGRALEDGIYESFRELFIGAKELVLHRRRRRAFVDEVIYERAQAVRREGAARELWDEVTRHWGFLLCYAVLGVAAFPVALQLQMSAAERAGCAFVLLYMMPIVQALLDALPLLARVRLAMENVSRLQRVASAPVECSDSTLSSLTAREPFQSLELRGVCYRHRRDSEEGTFLLGPIDLTLRPGEIVFLVGGNGSGKTTLAKLIVGLYEPHAGEILLNGAPITSVSRELLRQQFSAVFSEFHVFERLLGLKDPMLEEKATAWLRTLHLEHKVRIERSRFSTTQLSTGQRKRLALLVAALEERPICCFDEWAADQDPQYKRLFYTELLPELARSGKAVLVITHDSRYFQIATRRLTLEFGRLSGTANPVFADQRAASRPGGAIA